MAEKIHPRDTSPHAEENTEKPILSKPEKPIPPSGTYVVQIPKDQIYRYPPPENDRRYQRYARRKPRKSCCCRCFCWFLSLVTLLIVITAIACCVFYLVFRPKSPNYSVQKLSIEGFNLTSTSSPLDLMISPEIDVTVRTQNPNKKISIYYEKGSSVTVSHSEVELCNGVLPVFYQPTKNVTVFQTALMGSEVSPNYVVLKEQQKKGEIPLTLNLKVPVKIKVGSVKTWTVTVKVRCYITVDKLTVNASIISNKCSVDVKPWE